MYTVPDQSGRVFMVTGANTGIGKITARRLAEAGGHVFLACRSRRRAEPAVEDIREAAGHERVEFVELDLADFESVRSCAATFLRRDLPLHVLVNNAGVGGVSGTTKEGFEQHFGVNHLGHFLLTQLLLDRLRASSPARIVTVTSVGHDTVDGIDFEAVQRETESELGLEEYSISKLANALFSRELGERLEGTGVTTYALHPGVVSTDIWRTLPWPVRPLVKSVLTSQEEGAETTLYCATSPELADESGHYYEELERTDPNPRVADEALRARLWNKSLEWTGLEKADAQPGA